MGSSCPSTKPDVTLSLALSNPSPTVDALKPKERGVKLIQLLLTCANHASSGDLHHADACLQQISQLASVSGDSMQRLAARFALAVRLVKRWPGLYKALSHQSGPGSLDLDRARSIFARAFPDLGFANAIITRTVIHSMAEERVIHVIDLGSGDPKLWVPFIRNLGNLPQGPANLKMKITCVSANKAVLEKLGRKLGKKAESLNMPFQYNPVNVKLSELTMDMLEVTSGEAIALALVFSFLISQK